MDRSTPTRTAKQERIIESRKKMIKKSSSLKVMPVMEFMGDR
jgi:hypothetical protein